MLDILSEDYIRTARAKGLADGAITYKHALRNAMMPLVTIAGLQFGNHFLGYVIALLYLHAVRFKSGYFGHGEAAGGTASQQAGRNDQQSARK